MPAEGRKRPWVFASVPCQTHKATSPKQASLAGFVCFLRDAAYVVILVWFPGLARGLLKAFANSTSSRTLLLLLFGNSH